MANENMISAEVMQQLINDIRNISTDILLSDESANITYGARTISVESYKDKIYTLLNYYENKFLKE